MRRREFLVAVASAGAAAALGRGVRARTSATTTASKLVLSAPLTHSDWMLKPGIEWGPAGVKHMLDACKACGWSRIMWRAFDGGRADYPSKVARPLNDWDADSFWTPQSDEDRKLVEKYTANVTPQRKAEMLELFKKMDYSKFDALGEAIRYGHSIGLEIHAWVSINEDDHGWGIRSDFARDHQQFRWRRRDGRVYRSQMSFAFPEVRQYKLAILRELLDRYEIDGLFLDWIRTGDVRDNPQTDAQGVANSGYESPNVEAFKARFGVDPKDVANDDDSWVRLRAQPQTVFMRDVRKLVDSRAKRVPLSVMVGHPWHYRGMLDKIDGNLRGLLLDVTSWAREGLIDCAVAAGYYRDGGTTGKAFAALKEETLGRVDVWTYAWVPQNDGEFAADCAVADSVGAKQMLLWEADYIDDRANRAELSAFMAARAAPAAAR